MSAARQPLHVARKACSPASLPTAGATSASRSTARPLHAREQAGIPLQAARHLGRRRRHGPFAGRGRRRRAHGCLLRPYGRHRGHGCSGVRGRLRLQAHRHAAQAREARGADHLARQPHRADGVDERRHERFAPATAARQLQLAEGISSSARCSTSRYPAHRSARRPGPNRQRGHARQAARAGRAPSRGRLRRPVHRHPKSAALRRYFGVRSERARQEREAIHDETRCNRQFDASQQQNCRKCAGCSSARSEPDR